MTEKRRNAQRALVHARENFHCARLALRQAEQLEELAWNAEEAAGQNALSQTRRREKAVLSLKAAQEQLDEQTAAMTALGAEESTP